MINNRLNILLVDDSRLTYVKISDLLSEIKRWQCNLEWADSYAKGLEVMQRDAHDIYLLDHLLDENTGLDLIQKATQRERRAPMILISGSNEDLDMKAIAAGAADFIEKGQINVPVLERALRYGLGHREKMKKLRQKEQQLNAVANAIDGFIYNCSPDRRIEYMNDGAIKRSGSNVIGKPCHQVVHGRDSVCTECVHSRVLSGETVHSEVLSPKDNRWYHVISSPVLRADGRISNQSVLLDITERKKADEDLVFREAFETLIAKISGKFIELDPLETDHAIDHALSHLGEFTQMDRCLIALFSSDGTQAGYTHEWCARGGKLQPEKLQELNVPDLQWALGKIKNGKPLYVSSVADLPREASSAKEYWQEQGIRSLVALPIMANGKVAGLLELQSIRNENWWPGKGLVRLTRVAEIIGPALERKRAEEALHESEQRFRTMADSAPVMIWMVGPDLKFTFVNQFLLDFTGRTPEEEMSNNWTDIIHPDDRSKVIDVYEAAFSSREQFYVEYRVRRFDGFYCWVLDAGIPKFAPDGAFAGFLGSAVDITKQKNAEEQLRTLNDILERKVSHRTLALAQANEGLKTEVSERKKAEMTLKKNFNLLNTVIEGTADAIFLKDVEGHYVLINAAGARYVDNEAEDIIGKTDMELFAPEQAKKIMANDREVLKSGGPQTFEEVAQASDGVLRTFLATKSVYRDGNGIVEGLIGISRDITDRKKAEFAIQEKEAKYRSLFENSPISLWEEDYSQVREDLDGLRQSGVSDFSSYFEAHPEAVTHCAGLIKIVDVNSATLKMFKAASKEELFGNLDQILSEKSLPPFREQLIALAQGATTYETEGVNLTLEGDERLVHLRLSIAPGSEKNWSKVIVSLVDITEQKHLEERLHDEKAELEGAQNELQKAYADLQATQAKILQNEKMASIGLLAAGVAHEINNPMGYILSNLGTLDKYAQRLTDFIQAQTVVITELNGGDGTLGELRKQLKIDYIIDDLKNLTKESLEGADRVKKIVKDLKSFSRTDEGDHMHADINECIETTICVVWNEIKYKATLEKNYGDLPMTLCYPQQLNQVFLNLLINAAQAIEKQGTIKVRTWQEGDIIRVQIADTGRGIPKENLDRLFEPFFTTKKIGKGTGLGLSISYDIIKKHNGELDVKSEVGVGTTFTLSIPIREGL
ncbi:PAS domain S-box protein [uncultured Desulfuromonas sp.]|uniref:PAS domain S-box protein n=1 Tax=uncultured Desulfuromonas sp. TaxID=181013 RepID=UPI00260DB48A|nr:PAS domain S-box protein [uncultured Desulfuromonas sp.]